MTRTRAHQLAMLAVLLLSTLTCFSQSARVGTDLTPRLVGTWQLWSPNLSGDGYGVAYRFFADGRFTYSDSQRSDFPNPLRSIGGRCWIESDTIYFVISYQMVVPYRRVIRGNASDLEWGLDGSGLKKVYQDPVTAGLVIDLSKLSAKQPQIVIDGMKYFRVSRSPDTR